MAWIEEVINKKTRKTQGYRVKYRMHGKKIPGGVFHTKADAAQALPKFDAIEEAQKEMVGTKAIKQMPLLEMVHRYLDYKLSEGELLPRYRQERQRDLVMIIEEGRWTIPSDVTPASVVEWKTRKMGKGHRRGAYLRAMLAWAKGDLLQPIEDLTLTRLAAPQSSISNNERPPSALVNTWKEKARAAGPNVEALVHMLVSFGSRCVALAEMKVCDFNAQTGTIKYHDEKHKDITYNMPIGRDQKAIFLLNRITQGRDGKDHPLFISPRTGQGWNEEKDRTAISTWWHHHIDSRAGYQIRNLKYEAMSHMDEMGLSHSQIALFTGHKTTAQVDRYLRANDESRQRAMEKLYPTKPEVEMGAKWGQNVQRGETTAS